MRYSKLPAYFALSILAIVAITACDGDPSNDPGSDRGEVPTRQSVEVLAKSDGWRDGVREMASQPYALVEIAMERDVAEAAWDDNVPDGLSAGNGDPAQPGIYGDADSIDFNEQALVVFSSGQSGTCPAWVRDMSTLDDRVEIDLASSADQGQACTDDFQTYRLVMAVGLEKLPGTDDLPVERIDIPSENLTDVEGQVVAYPVG